ncbi:MAG: hypothetical protein FJW23_01195 [Acidimicrobiia bacterium]|nr:hypothetical protein [Acidimicrobiia bacterium]
MRQGGNRAVWSGALACLIAATAIAQVEFTNNFRYNSGQSVQPVFDGWSRLPDGSFNFHFGYLNRNYVEQPHVPVGEHNQIEPGGPDRGQPTYFYPRTHRNLFTVRVPADWGPRQDVIWTITVNGKTERAFGWLQKEWEIDPDGGASGGDNTDPDRLENRPPTLTIGPVAPVVLPAPAIVVASVADDGLPKPQPPAKRPVGQETPPTLQGGEEAPTNVPQIAAAAAVLAPPPGATRPDAPTQGLRVSWMLWRGPALALFDPVLGQPDNGDVTTTVTFSRPGSYVLRGTAFDGQTRVSALVPVRVD